MQGGKNLLWVQSPLQVPGIGFVMLGGRIRWAWVKSLSRISGCSRKAGALILCMLLPSRLAVVLAKS